MAYSPQFCNQIVGDSNPNHTMSLKLNKAASNILLKNIQIYKSLKVEYTTQISYDSIVK